MPSLGPLDPSPTAEPAAGAESHFRLRIIKKRGAALERPSSPKVTGIGRAPALLPIARPLPVPLMKPSDMPVSRAVVVSPRLSRAASHFARLCLCREAGAERQGRSGVGDRRLDIVMLGAVFANNNKQYENLSASAGATKQPVPLGGPNGRSGSPSPRLGGLESWSSFTHKEVPARASDVRYSRAKRVSEATCKLAAAR